MIRKEFSLDKIPFLPADHNTGHITLKAGGIIDIMTDDPNEAARVKSAVITSLQSHIDSYSGRTAVVEIPDMTVRVEEEVTGEIARTTGADIILKFDYILPDERSQKLLDDMEKMKKFSDPAVAAAELERAMKQAQETAEKNGMSMTDIQNMPMPEFPALPDTDDPLARAMALSEQAKLIRQMAGSAPLGAASHSAPPVQPERPKFCGSCGGKLPESGNFCPNCGARI